MTDMDIIEARKIAYEFPNVRFVHDRRTDRWRFEDPRADAVSEFLPLTGTTETTFIERIEQASQVLAELHGESPYGLATCRGYRTPEVMP